MVGRGWTGITNGDLLQRMRGEYDALVTLPFGALLLRTPSNRMVHLQPLVPAILAAFRRSSQVNSTA